MRLPASVRARFRRHGRDGGRRRARALTPEARRAIARGAALRRWIRARFGAAHFAELDLPGGDLVDRGLDDLCADRETPESLLVSLAAPRLRREGVPLPQALQSDGDRRLYRALEAAHGDLAHARYLALLSRMTSFADSCRGARIEKIDRA